MDDRERLNRLFQYPLFEALAHRRTRRFGLGYEISDGVTTYKSTKAPVPLSELELAILCWAADGVNGVALGEQQLITNVHSSWNGRTHPYACNSQHTVLAFINDEGVFYYTPGNATKVVEIQTEEDRKRILEMYRQGIRKMFEGRPQFPPSAWLSSNQWFANRPGSTFFVPVVDMTAEYINFCLFAFEREGYFIMDQQTGQPCGLQKWIDNGYFKDKNFYLPLLMFEGFVYNVVAAAAHYKIQNLALACEAMGLGNFTWAGFTPVVLLGGTPFTRGLGATFVTDKAGMPNPVAIGDHLKAFCPPNFRSMDEAVDAVVAERWADDGIFGEAYRGVTPFKDWPSRRKALQKHRPEAVQVTKDFCNYVYSTYGRFPAFFDSLQVPVGATVHHLDLDFYATYYPPEVLTDAHRNHMALWHQD